MTKKHSTKRSLIASIIIVVLCCSMLVGTTFAWFTDSATSAGNIIKTGNLDVEMYWADGTKAVPAADSKDWKDASVGAIFNYENWEPGYVEVRHIRIANEGSLALKYSVSIIPNGEVTDLSDVIDVYYVDPAAQVADRAALTDSSKIGTLTEVLLNLGATGNGTLVAGAADTVTIALKMQEGANNDHQDKSIGTSFSIQLLATQLSSESDSFDNGYDADAAYRYEATSNIGANESVSVADVEITLPSTATEGNYTIAVENKRVETNANNETTVSLDINLLKDGVKVEAEENVAYTVAVDIGRALVLNSLTHKGTPVEDYSYNAQTGILTFTTDSFSPFAYTYSENVIKVNSAEDLIAALDAIKVSAKQQIPGENGNKKYRENAIFVLENDIVIDANTKFMYTDSNGAPLHFYGVKGVLDLNGHSITVTEDALLAGKTYANAALLIQYSDLDIIGEGSIVTNNKSIPVYGWANSTVNIYGGNYITNAPERNESAIYVNNATVLINVYGGSYSDAAYAFNVHNNCGSTTVIVLHEGIEYADFFKDTTDLTKQDINAGRIAFADGCELTEYEADGIAMNKVVKK
ncbi:MAG: SipW-dependent-type signal peptide-containing protein [Clostridia bacterium]|nr:SipW-dependent-type signal peptide-containing protein [Clostridia bacterium]